MRLAQRRVRLAEEWAARAGAGGSPGTPVAATAAAQYRSLLAESYCRLGEDLVEDRDMPEAEQSVTAGVDLWKKLVAESPASPEYRRGAARGHLQAGTVDEVTPPFLGQRAIALSRQRVRALEELLEHSRTSTGGWDGRPVRLYARELCGVQPAEEVRILERKRRVVT